MSDLRFQSKNRQGGFTQVDNSVIRSTKLTMQAKCLYAQLLAYAWGGSVFPGRDRLAKENNVHPNTIDKHMKELKDIGLVEVKRRGLGKTNLYILKDITNLVYENLAVSRFTVECDTDSHHSVNLESHPSVNKEYEVEEDKEEEAAAPQDMKEIIEAYQQRISQNISAVFEYLEKDCIEFGKELVIHAIEEAGKNNARSYRYLESILKRYRNENVKQISDLQTKQKKNRASIEELANF